MKAKSVVLSSRAEADIDAIASYSKEKWGTGRAEVYLRKLEEDLTLLARTPLVGRSCDSIRPGLRRFEIESHVVFYRIYETQIRVVRVLHQRMLPVQSRFAP